MAYQITTCMLFIDNLTFDLCFFFSLQMKCTGIPELRSVEDLEYLRSVLVLDKSDSQAEDHFKGEIHRCLKLQWSTQINWLTHNFVHRQS